MRILGFDIARSFSMIYIIAVLHLSEYTALHITQLSVGISLIWSMLSVFTFLSAFLSAQNDFTSQGMVVKFYKKRLIRFYPLFLISSIVLLLIGFNEISCTIKGLLGISPYCVPQQKTLWYIAMLISFYLITPYLCHTSKMRMIIRFCLVLLFLLGLHCVTRTIDLRTFYYIIIYFIGLYIGVHYKQMFHVASKFNMPAIVFSAIWIVMLVCLCYTNNRILMMATGYIGAIAIISVSMSISTCLHNMRTTFIKDAIVFVSYASMCAYLFHRVVYWLCLQIWSPESDITTLAYLFIVGFPLTMILSYYIQKIYDKSVK